MKSSKKTIAIIGGGASALMFACSINTSKYDVTIIEKNKTLGRKFLVAGNGGFNLTHSENITEFANRYTPTQFLTHALNHFSNTDFINWLISIGIETYVGSSKRVFPKKGIKPIEVLNAILTKIEENKVIIKTEYDWQGFENEQLIFENSGLKQIIKSDITIFALGGASWKITGSAGDWVTHFSEKNIAINPFYASNCAYKINWDSLFLKKIDGKVLKNCLFTCGNKTQKGEAVLTKFGIEGSGIYPLSSEIREQLITNNSATLIIDFKPDISIQELEKRIAENSQLSIKDLLLKKINLSDVQISLLKQHTTKEEYLSPKTLGSLIKSFPIQLTDFAPIDEAISTVGGIALTELTGNFELTKMPNTYCLGEMLDFDAPTGGYLLQASFSMAKFTSDYLNAL